MDKKILFFDFTDIEMKKLGAALSSLDAELINVPPEDCGRSIGALLGLPIESGTAPTAAGKMLVMSGFDRDSITALLSLMKNAGYGTDVLKAVATPANISWTPGQLYSELSAEHAYMNRAKK